MAYKRILSRASNISASFYTHCDEDDAPSLVEQADAAIQNEKSRIRTPMQFENLRGTLNQGSPHTFDGLRVAVQKQVNLNTVVSHFYWMGSQQMQQPMYQYRIILPYDDKIVNVATDMDFNIEGEAKGPIAKNTTAKSTFVLGGEQKSLTVDIDIHDDSSATQLQYTTDGGNTYQMSHMQAITPSISLGGVGQFNLKKNSFQTGYGGIYDKGETLIAGQYGMDSHIRLLYLRRVNPNRVHLSAELHVDEKLESDMALGAEYTMKQSKLHLSVDSNLLIKSSLETTISPGVSMQLCAEMQQAGGHYKFGTGITLG